MLNAIISATILIFLVFILMRAFGGKMRARSRYLIWGIVALRLMIPVGVPNLDPLYEFSINVKSSSDAPPVVQSEDSAPISFTENPAKNENTASQGSVQKVPAAETGKTQQLISAESDKTQSTVQPAPETPAEVINQQTQTVQTQAVAPNKNQTENEVEAQREQLPSIVEGADDTNTSHPAAREIDAVIYKICLIVWVLGAAGLMMFYMISYAVLQRKIGMSLQEISDSNVRDAYQRACARTGVRTPPPLVVCAGIGSPMVMGYFRPKIYLPEKVPEAAMEGILTHELIHFRRRDVWVKLAGTFLKAMYWFHPLVYAAIHRMEREMELSCDEKVLACYNHHQRYMYAEGMLDILRDNRDRSRSSISTPLFSPSKNEVRERIMNIMDTSVKKRGIAVIALVLALSIVAGSLVACTVFSEISLPKQTENALEFPAAETAELKSAKPGGDVRGKWAVKLNEDEYQILDEITVGDVRHFVYCRGSEEAPEFPVFLGYERKGKIVGYNPYNLNDYNWLMNDYEMKTGDYVKDSLRVEEIAEGVGYQISWALSFSGTEAEYNRGYLWYGDIFYNLESINGSYAADIDGDGTLECICTQELNRYNVLRIGESGLECFDPCARMRSELYGYNYCEWIRDNLFICYREAEKSPDDHRSVTSGYVGRVVKYQAGTVVESEEYSYTVCRLLTSLPDEREKLKLPEIDTRTLVPTDIDTYGVYTVLSVGEMKYICDTEGKALYATDKMLEKYPYRRGMTNQHFQTDAGAFFIEKNPVDGEYYQVWQDPETTIQVLREDRFESSIKEIARETFFNPETPYQRYRFYQEQILWHVPQGRCRIYEDWDSADYVLQRMEQKSVGAYVVRIATQDQIEELQTVIESQYKESLEAVPKSLLETGKRALVTGWGEYLLPPEYDEISGFSVRTDCVDGAVYLRVKKDGVSQLAVYDPVNAQCEVLPQTYQAAGIPKEIMDSAGDIYYVTWVYDGEACYPVKYKSEVAENLRREEITQAQQAAYEAVQVLDAKKEQEREERIWVPSTFEERIYLEPLPIDISAVKPVSMDIYVIGDCFCLETLRLYDENKWLSTLTLIYDGQKTYVCTLGGQVIFEAEGKLLHPMCFLMIEGDSENSFHIGYDAALKQYFIVANGGHGGGYTNCYYDTASGKAYRISACEGPAIVEVFGNLKEHGNIDENARYVVREITLPEGWDERHLCNALWKDEIVIEELIPDDSKFGVCDREGNLIVAPEYDFIVGYRSGYTVARKGDSYMYLTEDGKVFENQTYAMAASLSDVRTETGTVYAWVYDGETCQVREFPAVEAVPAGMTNDAQTS